MTDNESAAGREVGPAADDVALLTVAEVADRLRVSERFVRKLIADRHLPAVNVGSRMVRVRRSDVVALLRPVGSATPR